MKVAVLGGGFTGLTASYWLAKKNHKITIFEKEPVLGGLAQGFRANSWNWYVERTIHHLFSNDHNILDFCQEIEFNNIFFKKPETASLYENSKLRSQSSKIYSQSKDYSIYPLDNPLDLLRFPLLSFPERIRAGLILALLKLSPLLSIYEKTTALSFLEKTMGRNAAEILFGELFRKKFGKFAGNILTSFIWARIKKRTKKLGYVEGGFQTLINHLVSKLKSLQVKVLTGYEVKTIEKRKRHFLINGEEFDTVVSTLPTPIVARLGERIFPESYVKQLKQVNFLHAVSLILETDNPILENTYWLNICTKNIPLMGIFQHTNFAGKNHYGGKHLIYCGWYVKEESELWSMNKEQIASYIEPFLNKISNVKYQTSNIFLFKAPWAQPIFDKNFLKNKPNFITPIKSFYIANLDMTYPYDRGTNYAVKLGKQVAELL